MTPKEIIKKCSMLEIYDKRSVTDEYVELVFYSKEIDKWNRIFADVLGPAIKPPGIKPTEDDLHLTKDYGGIWGDQTLFKKDFNNTTIISMFWPWQDNIHTTLKTVLIKKA
jgi:hypothetical protein